MTTCVTKLKLAFVLTVSMLSLSMAGTRADAADTGAVGPEALHLVQTIDLPNSPIFDHTTIDRVHNRAYIAASGARGLQVVDLKTGKWIKTIEGVGKPANLMYHQKLDRVIYSVDSGHVRFMNPNNFQVETEIVLAGDADCMRWDPIKDILYVVNGGSAVNEDYVRMTGIDLKTRKVVSELNVPGDKLEFLTLETRGPRLFVNNVDTSKVDVIDRDQSKIVASWDLPAKTPYAQALAEKQRRLFVVTREPAKLVVLDIDSGKVIAQVPTVEGVDDIAYDVVLKRLYLSGIDGVVDVIEQKDADIYAPYARIKTRQGARTSAFSQEQGRLYVPLPIKSASQKSQLLVYETIK